MRFYNTSIEEQETQISIDYKSKVLSIYSSRKSIIQRLNKKVGDANKSDYINNAITGASWDIPFSDRKKITSALSKPILIGQMK